MDSVCGKRCRSRSTGSTGDFGLGSALQRWVELPVFQGFSVLIAQYFGAKDEKGMKKTIAMSVSSGVGITLI